VHVPAGATGHFTAVHVVDATGDQHVESGVWLRLVDSSGRQCASAVSFRKYDGDTLRLDPVATPPVTYANRDGGDGVRRAVRAGWYHILVKLGLGDGPKPPVTEIAVSVTGDKADGPTYAELSMPSTPPLPKPHPGWQPASSATLPKAHPGWPSASSASATQPSAVLLWWPIAGIAGVLVLGGALALRRVRRR
jgi:hypothetical protein